MVLAGSPSELLKKFVQSGSRLLFSAGEKPYLSLRLKKGDDPLKLGRKLVEEYAATAAPQEEADTPQV